MDYKHRIIPASPGDHPSIRFPQAGIGLSVVAFPDLQAIIFLNVKLDYDTLYSVGVKFCLTCFWEFE